MIFYFILKLRQKVAFTGWFERFQNRGVGISLHQSLLFLPSRLHLAVMETKRRRYRWDRIAGAGITLATALVLFVAWITPETRPAAYELAHPGIDELGELSESAAAEIAEAHPVAAVRSESMEEVLPCSCNKRVLKLPKNPYTAHQQAARNLPSSFFVKDKSEMDAGKKRGKLVSVTDGRGYHIAPLSHSYAVLLPEVASLLEDMGQAFADQLEGTPSAGTTFRVTSLTRTARQQDRLGRRNYNAIQEASTHSYGASFDIAYTDRPSNEADCSAPTRAIQRVLSSFQKSGRILVIPERNCMHITLRP